jgi:hypothetical protein
MLWSFLIWFKTQIDVFIKVEEWHKYPKWGEQKDKNVLKFFLYNCKYLRDALAINPPIEWHIKLIYKSLTSHFELMWFLIYKAKRCPDYYIFC